MDISVIIVNYNVRYFLEQCIYSVLNASKGLEVEIIVVDNNSVDGSCQMLREKFPDITLIDNKHNVGFSKANNQAFSIAMGKYLLILNPDTVVQENSLKACFDFMEYTPDAGSMGVKMIDGKGNYLPESKRGFPTPAVAFFKIFGLSKLFPRSRRFGRYHLGYLDKEKTHVVDVLPGAFMFTRRSLLEQVGYFDEDFFMYGEDIDLSYRITRAGFKNYYYPGTIIIHYKGESTKKGSINYVVVFYRAMVIFARKHFSSSNARLFGLLINFAIYLRAAISILRRSITAIANPLLNALVTYISFRLFLPFWEEYVFSDPGKYPPLFLNLVFPAYIFIWLAALYASGAFRRQIGTREIVRGIVTGTLIILVIYALMPEHLRFSRALILFGAIICIAATFFTRLLLSVIDKAHFRIYFTQPVKRMVIVGDKKEADRVFSILSHAQIKSELAGIVSPSARLTDSEYIGHLAQLEDIVAINNVDEVIFCSKNLSSQDIIGNMLRLGQSSTDFKIAPPESLSVIGSNSINTAGDLYTININSIANPHNRLKKRAFDLLFSLLLFLGSPVLLFVMKNSRGFLKNICGVLIGKYGWVGYCRTEGNSGLPELKKGILNPMFALRRSITDPALIERIDILYAKDYRWALDLKIVLNGLAHLGDNLDERN